MGNANDSRTHFRLSRQALADSTARVPMANCGPGEPLRDHQTDALAAWLLETSENKRGRPRFQIVYSGSNTAGKLPDNKHFDVSSVSIISKARCGGFTACSRMCGRAAERLCVDLRRRARPVCHTQRDEFGAMLRRVARGDGGRFELNFFFPCVPESPVRVAAGFKLA
jgi:hypothetical protein